MADQSANVELGAVVKTFTYRNPFRLLLVLIPAFSILFFLVVLGSPTHLISKIVAGLATAISVPGYVWFTRRSGKSSVAEVHELGFRYLDARVKWSDIANAGHAKYHGLDILTVRCRDNGNTVQIQGHLHGLDLTSEIVQGLRRAKIPIVNQ
jgi:hypothetical protein